MMRIQFLTGDATGTVKDVPDAEGAPLVASGVAAHVPYTSPEPDETSAPETDGGSLSTDDEEGRVAGVPSAPADEQEVPARVRRRKALPKTDPPARHRKRR